MAVRASAVRYEQLTVYERTLIEVTEAFIASGQYAPGPLVMQLAKDATNVLMGELGYAEPFLADGVAPFPTQFKEWNRKR